MAPDRFLFWTVEDAERVAAETIADLRATHEDEIATRDAEIARLQARLASRTFRVRRRR